jgi:hypothetical protein
MGDGKCVLKACLKIKGQSHNNKKRKMFDILPPKNNLTMDQQCAFKAHHKIKGQQLKNSGIFPSWINLTTYGHTEAEFMDVR